MVGMFISSKFCFTSMGPKHLFDHNRANNTAIKVLRGQTIQVSDLDNLSLYLRRKIRDYCLGHNLRSPKIVVKRGFILLKVSSKITK
ncbi:hypothetical protein GCK32_012675 [Trichostrongylus colubriformis]|uniref:Uncharacterized protein n=1 Tax=Trichostrongylus colubriformis TaxID=6319 RepID=A0AAN8EWH3_TRICO